MLALACTDPVLQLDGDAANGAVLYDQDCLRCHGTDGEGTSRGAPLAGISERKDAAFQVQIIREGIGEMQPFEGTDQDLADVLAFLSTL